MCTWVGLRMALGKRGGSEWRKKSRSTNLKRSGRADIKKIVERELKTNAGQGKKTKKLELESCGAESDSTIAEKKVQGQREEESAKEPRGNLLVGPGKSI